MGDNPPKEISISTAGIIFGFLFDVLYPIILTIIWCKFFEGKVKNTFIGIGGFIIALSLESIFLLLISLIFGENSLIFYIFVGISPGIFEETARYFFLD